MFQRKVFFDDVCGLCRFSGLTILHDFWLCRGVKDVWKEVDFAAHLHHKKFSSFINLCCEVLSNSTCWQRKRFVFGHYGVDKILLYMVGLGRQICYCFIRWLICILNLWKLQCGIKS